MVRYMEKNEIVGYEPLVDDLKHLIQEKQYHVLKTINCNGVQREHNKKLNNGLPILHKVPPK